MAKTGGALQTALTIQGILGEFGIVSPPLEDFIENAKKFPNDELHDEYNKLVTNYQNANGYEDLNKASGMLLKFYDENAEFFKDKADVISDLRKIHNANVRLNEEFEKLNQQIKNREL